MGFHQYYQNKSLWNQENTYSTPESPKNIVFSLFYVHQKPQLSSYFEQKMQIYVKKYFAVSIHAPTNIV